MSEFAPCPKCAASQAERIGFTWWGGLVGPRMLTHVKCLNCGTAYNGKTGQSNTTGIVIYTALVAVVSIGLMVMLLRL